MKRLRLRILNIILALLATVVMAACSQADDPVVPGKEISLFSRADGGDADQSAHLMFWKEADYKALLAGNSPAGSPFTTADMPQDIDTYKLSESGTGMPFTTFRPYPMSPPDDFVYAVGFAPTRAFDKTLDGYRHINIADDYRDGLTDFLASNNDGSSKGSYEQPFVKDGNSEEIIKYNLDRMLEFRHLTACISFVAFRSENMYMKIGVKDVLVEIANDDKKLAVPTSIKTYCDENKWTYVAGNESTPTVLSKMVPGDVLMEEGKQLARFFVNSQGIVYGKGDGEFNPFTGLTESDESKRPTLKVNIEATLYWIQDPSQTWNLRWENLEVKSWNLADDSTDVATGDRFLPSYKYQVAIRFNNTSVGLMATQVPWVEGGTFYYPVWDKTTQE